MEIHGIAPWVGAGTFTEPYSFNVLFLSWYWRAQLIDLDLTCWDSTTGQFSGDAERMSDMAQLINNARVVMDLGSCALVRTEAPDWCCEMLIDPLYDLPVVGGGVTALAAHVRTQEAALLARLSAAFPSYNWSTPVLGAVETIDKSRSGSAESMRLWEYYRDIINPNLATPTGPAELFEENLIEHEVAVDVARVQEVLAVPDDLASRVWRCELAYRLMVYSEARVALEQVGL